MENEFRIKILEKEIEKIKNSINNSIDEKNYKIMKLEYEIVSIKSES